MSRAGAPIARLRPGARRAAATGLPAPAVRAASVTGDEPSAAPCAAESARVDAKTGAPKARRLAILIISHRPDRVFRLSDRLRALRRGRTIMARETAWTDKNEVVAIVAGVSA